MALTDRTIRNAKPKKSPYRLRDNNSVTKGLGITVAPAGSKTFFLGYTSPATGKRTQVNLGRYPGTSLKQARDKAIAYRDEIARGADPKETIKQQKQAEKALANRPTVEALFNAYITDLEIDEKPSAGEVRRIFNKHIKDVIGSKVAAEITAEDILDVLTPIVRRGSLVHADNVRAYLRAAFEFGLHAGSTTRWRGRVPQFLLEHNPVTKTKKAVRRKAVGDRTLDGNEVRLVWNAAGLSKPSRLALKLLIATGQRVEEVLHATWSEFDLDQRLWTIPAERRKNRANSSEPHLVPLTDFHVTLLEEIRNETKHSTWLFPHKDKKGPRKRDALYQATHRFCEASDIPSFSPRDCRRTFKTLTGSIGIDLELRNRLQGHAMTDVGSVHYDRWSYLPEKRRAMEKWAEWLEALIDIEESLDADRSV